MFSQKIDIGETLIERALSELAAAIRCLETRGTKIDVVDSPSDANRPRAACNDRGHDTEGGTSMRDKRSSDLALYRDVITVLVDRLDDLMGPDYTGRLEHAVLRLEDGKGLIVEELAEEMGEPLEVGLMRALASVDRKHFVL